MNANITTTAVRHPNPAIGAVRGRLLRREGDRVTIEWAGMRVTGPEITIEMMIEYARAELDGEQAPVAGVRDPD